MMPEDDVEPRGQGQGGGALCSIRVLGHTALGFKMIRALWTLNPKP